MSSVALAVCFCKFLYFVGHDGKALTRFASARRLDGSVQGQQIGLLCDGRDDFDDLADLSAGNAQLRDGRIGGFGRLDGFPGDASGFGCVLGNVRNG